VFYPPLFSVCRVVLEVFQVAAVLSLEVLEAWQEVLEVFQVAAVLSLEALEAWREGLFLASAKALGVVVEPCLP
jgi:hypothetical protein